MFREHDPREAARNAAEDDAAREAAAGRVRMLRDPEYRRRYAAYLRGEMTLRDAMQRTSHRAWYEQVYGRSG